MLFIIVVGYILFIVEEFESNAWISISSILLPAIVTIPLSIFIFKRDTSLVAFTIVTSIQLFFTAVFRVSLVYGGFVSYLSGIDAFGMLGLNLETYLIFALSGIIPAYCIKRNDPGPGFRVYPIIFSSLGVFYTYNLSLGFWSRINTLDGLMLFLAEITAPAVYALLGIWTARYWKKSYYQSFHGITRQQRSDGVVFMLIYGWVYKWDTYSVTILGGNGRANDLAVHEGVLYEAEPSGVISWQTGEFVPTASNMWATSICSHEGKLYHAVSTGPSGFDQSMIFETLTGILVAERKYSVHTLCSHNNRLYDGGLSGVFDTFSNKIVTDRPVSSLCSHNNQLYDGGSLGIYETISGREVAYRGNEVFALCSYQGILYDSTYGAVYNTLTNLVAFHFRDIIHKTKTRTVFGYKLKGRRLEIQVISGMIPICVELLKKFEKPLNFYMKAINKLN